MDTRVGINTRAHATNLKSERRLFKSSLHLSGTELAEIATVGGRAALAELSSDSLEVLGVFDLANEVLDVLNGLLLGASDRLVAVGVVGVARPNMLLQNVATANGRHLFTSICFLITNL